MAAKAAEKLIILGDIASGLLARYEAAVLQEIGRIAG